MVLAATIQSTEELRGKVLRVLYQSETYHALLLACCRHTVTVTGHFTNVAVGEVLKCQGTWSNHPKYGRQFNAESYSAVLPGTEKGVLAYLASGMLPGIGPALAKRIVAHLGVQVLDSIRTNPTCLLDVPGIGKKKAGSIVDGITRHQAVEDVVVALRPYGVSPTYAVRIVTQYGSDAVTKIRDNPYLLTAIRGIGFLIADKVAMQMGVATDSPDRSRAAILHAITTAAEREGHCFLDEPDLIARTLDLLRTTVTPTDIVAQLVESADARTLHVVTNADSRLYYLPPIYACETGIAKHMARLLRTRRPLPVTMDTVRSIARTTLGLTLAAQQEQALETSLAAGVMVLTGGPGTGKTTIVRALVDACQREHHRVLLAAPTGRAAQRLSACCGGAPAKTIHRLLEYCPGTHGFVRNEKNPLDADLVVVDESSMLDVYLAYALLRAIPDGCSLVLVGDAHQLPSVGAGRVLDDIIRSEHVPVVRLNVIYRQAQNSLIVRNAHRIQAGVMPLDSRRAGIQTPDFYFLPEDDPAIVHRLVVDLVTRRLPVHYGLDPIHDIQVLSPMRRGPIGIEALNASLQTALNGQSTSQRVSHIGTTYAIGDKVMQIRNNYTLDVMNGDIGFVTAVEPNKHSLKVHYPQGEVEYTGTDLNDLSLAYAVSVHKSQGSEYPAIVVPIHTQHYIMLQRTLLYTAITRGKRLVVLVGQPKAIACAVRTHLVTTRNTRLADILAASP